MNLKSTITLQDSSRIEYEPYFALCQKVTKITFRVSQIEKFSWRACIALNQALPLHAQY